MKQSLWNNPRTDSISHLCSLCLTEAGSRWFFSIKNSFPHSSTKKQLVLTSCLATLLPNRCWYYRETPDSALVWVTCYYEAGFSKPFSSSCRRCSAVRFPPKQKPWTTLTNSTTWAISCPAHCQAGPVTPHWPHDTRESIAVPIHNPYVTVLWTAI